MKRTQVLKIHGIYILLSFFYLFIIVALIFDFYSMVIVDIEPRIWGSEAFAQFGWAYESKKNYAIEQIITIITLSANFAFSLFFYKKGKRAIAYFLLLLIFLLPLYYYIKDYFI